MKYKSYLPLFSFAVLVGASLLLIAVTDHYILNINFYENSENPLAGDPARDFYVYRELTHWIYFYTVIYLLLKLTVISLLLQSALQLSGSPDGFARIFNWVAIAEAIFLIPAAIKIYWFYNCYPAGNLAQWHRFYVLSALSFLPNAPADWIYPLQTLNLFEIAYWFLLAFGIKQVTGLDYEKSIQVILKSYLPALFIWVVAVTFCTLLLSPATG